MAQVDSGVEPAEDDPTGRDQRVKDALDGTLPAVVWLPIYYLVYVPVAFVTGLSVALMAGTMPWSLAALTLGGVWIIFGKATMQAVLLWGVAGVLLAGMVSHDGDAGPIGTARSYAARRAEKYVKWSVWHSFKW